MAPEAPAGAASAATAPEAVGAAAATLHAARRFAFGPTPDLLAELAAAGFDTWLEQQLAPQRIDDLEADRRLWALSTLGFDVGRLLSPALPALDGLGLTGVVDGTARLLATTSMALDELAESLLRHSRLRIQHALAELRLASVVRATYSRRQLLELMVDHWWNRFNVWPGKGLTVAASVPAFDREAIRPHALGRFTDLLHATATSTAMLAYLDSWLNRAEAPNENYGRELLELHTVGVAGGFTESDVRDAARVFTGWSVDLFTGRFRFEPSWHDAGPKRVLDWTTPGRSGAGGVEEGRALLTHLAQHPATARRVATELVRRFVADDPPADLVDAAAAAYLQSGTAIAPVLRLVATSEACRASAGTKVRRPLDFLVGALRATGADVGHPIGPSTDAGRSIDGALRRLGQRPFDAASPAGYPEQAAAWLGAGLLPHWVVAHELARGQLIGVAVDPAALSGGNTAAGPLVDHLLARLHGAVDPDRRAALLDALGATDATPVDAARVPDVVGLALCAAEGMAR